MLGLFVEGALISLPTAEQSGERIAAFYDAHRQVIVVQQVVGILLLVPLLAFALTLAEDLADAALFAAIAVFAFVAALAEPSWVRIVGLVAAALTLVRAFASPLGVTALDAAAPLAFLAFVLVLSVRILVTDLAWRA